MHFTRLSIIDLSEDGMQPMHSSCGQYVMTFNGEIVNFRDLATQYGLQLRGRSDSEVLLELYRVIGPRVGCVARGMFSFVVYDKRERSAVGFRDPFGIKPLYYTESGAVLMLSSEIKPLLCALGGAEVDERGVIRFLKRGEVDDGSTTLYRGIKQVPPGHMVAWKDGKVSVHRYRDDDFAQGQTSDEKTAHAAYYETLRRTVGEYLYADVRVAVSLSGGFDSSLLAHLVRANRPTDERLLMFTRGYQDYEGNELEAAHGVGQQFGFEYHPVLLRPEEVPDMLRRCSEQQEHPITSISVLAFHKLYQQARAAGVTVLLEGQGGDEIWAGYSSYQDPNSQAQSHDGSSFALNDEVIRCQDSSDPEPWRDAIGSSFSSSSLLTQRQLDDLFGPKLQRALRFVDRASMNAHVEVRVPYLDPVVALPALRVPDTWKIRNGQMRSFVREMARPYLGEAVALRPKVAVQDPQRLWLQKQLVEFVTDILDSKGLFVEQFVDIRLVRRLYEQFLTTSERFENLTFLVFPVFLEEWYQAMRPHLAARSYVCQSDQRHGGSDAQRC